REYMIRLVTGPVKCPAGFPRRSARAGENVVHDGTSRAVRHGVEIGGNRAARESGGEAKPDGRRIAPAGEGPWCSEIRHARGVAFRIREHAAVPAVRSVTAGAGRGE